jgi:uncharacterized membrane protein
VEPMEIIALVLRWLHILSAIALMGGSIFMRFALHPALAALGEEQQKALKAAVRSQWAKWVMASSGFLLLSGIVNVVLYTQSGEIEPMPYHAILTVKMLLALAIMFIASTLVGRSANAEKFRANSVKWLNINLAMAVIVVCLGGYLRTLHQTPAAEKPEDNKETAQVFSPQSPHGQ